MEEVVEIEDTSPASVLPREIWSQIFTFLPLNDRKCVRLTCRSWYNCCASVNITKYEKFVFRTDPGVKHIAEVMLRSSSLLNLEFQGLPVGTIPENVWKERGQRMRELEFYNCQWDDETISNVILHCENLTSLVITNIVVNGDDGRIRLSYSARLLNDFIEKGIRRPKLHTLSIFIEYDEHESVLRKIFLLHPCIKHFTLALISDRSDLPDPYMIRLDECLNPDTRLESFTSTIVTPTGYVGTLVDQTEQGLRLKYLETWLENKEFSPDLENKQIINFFRSQQNLETIKLTTRTASSKELFYNILESCPNLREFYFNTRCWNMNFKPSEVPRFIASISKLKCLELGFQLWSSEEVAPFSDQLNLASLNWKYHCHDSDFRNAFLQCCPSLKHLRLTQCCDTTLQIIFQYLPELQTLVLDNDYAKKCTEFGFFGLTEDGYQDGYSIKSLQHLKHLELLSVPAIILTERTALELQLPRLEFLSLHVRWFKRLSEEALNHFAFHLPELRVLAVDLHLECHYDFLEDTIRFCKKLKNLHRLVLPWHFFFEFNISMSIKKAESIFSACPGLRYISGGMGTFMRDPFTGQVLRKEHLKFPEYVFKFPSW